MATNGNTVHHQEQYGASAHPAEVTSTSGTNIKPSKDEVGWYFVEQYYTTLSKNPGKLHLFYNKKSQFVQGPEAELVNVAVGRQAIQQRIRELDFQDCKVRVSNVDSQASYDNIVIQVIGEISNKSGEPKKFVQTFILAQQPAGYFLLNDILRYINEGEEETTDGPVPETAPVAESEVPQEPVAEPEPEKAEVEEVAQEIPASLDTQAVDKKLEEASSNDAKDSASASAADSPAELAAAAEESHSKTETVEAVPDPEKTAEEVAEEETKKPEVPKDPSPTPAPSRAPAPEPEKPKEPPKPMTWASRIAAAAGPVKPVVPVVPKTAAPPAQARPAAPTTPAAPAQPNAPAQPEAPAQAANKEVASEWRTAGADSKRQSRQQPVVTVPASKEEALAYVKFVTEKVKDEDLRAALAGYGELVYFDINRSKNCAFVEYATPAGYQAAIGASPIVVNGENIVIEPRRPKAGAYGGVNYNQNRGSISGRGRFDGQRAGSQGGGRGGYVPRGRGGASRGRGGPQVANA